MFLFAKLKVYQRAVGLAERVSTLTSKFPRGSWYLADQLNRASLSISLNIAEGNGRSTERDRRNFFSIARGSVHECVPLIELCQRGRLLADGTYGELRDELEAIAKMLSGLMKERRRPRSSRTT
jgi:four helix bundle protein